MKIKLEDGREIDSMAVRVYEEFLSSIARVALLGNEELVWLRSRISDAQLQEDEPVIYRAMNAFKELLNSELDIVKKNGGAPCPPPRK